MIAAGKCFVSRAPDHPETHAADPATPRSARSRTDVPACLQPEVMRVENVAAHRSLFCRSCEVQDKLFSQEAASRHLSHRASACSSNIH